MSNRSSSASASTLFLDHTARRLVCDETGQDLVEYALLAGSIGLVGIVAWDSIVTGIGNAYTGWDTGTQAIWEPADPGA